ncbi:hypothetical protein GCM10028777_30400 [Angustibacter speluncae]
MSAPHASISVDPTRLEASARSLEAAALDTRRAQARLGSLGPVPAGVEGGARAAANAAVQQAISVVPRQVATVDSLAQQLRSTGSRARQIFEASKPLRQVAGLRLSVQDWADDTLKENATREKALRRGRELGLRGRALEAHTARAVRREHGTDSMTRRERRVFDAARRQGQPAPGLRGRYDDYRTRRGDLGKVDRLKGAAKAAGGGDPAKRGGKLGVATTALSTATTLADGNLSGAQKRRAIANTVITNGLTKGLTKVVPGPGWLVGGGIMAIDAATGGGATKTISKGVDVGIRGVEAAGKGVVSVGKGAVGLVKKIPTPW